MWKLAEEVRPDTNGLQAEALENTPVLQWLTEADLAALARRGMPSASLTAKRFVGSISGALLSESLPDRIRLNETPNLSNSAQYFPPNSAQNFPVYLAISARRCRAVARPRAQVPYGGRWRGTCGCSLGHGCCHAYFLSRCCYAGRKAARAAWRSQQVADQAPYDGIVGRPLYVGTYNPACAQIHGSMGGVEAWLREGLTGRCSQPDPSPRRCRCALGARYPAQPKTRNATFAASQPSSHLSIQATAERRHAQTAPMPSRSTSGRSKRLRRVGMITSFEFLAKESLAARLVTVLIPCDDILQALQERVEDVTDEGGPASSDETGRRLPYAACAHVPRWLSGLRPSCGSWRHYRLPHGLAQQRKAAKNSLISPRTAPLVRSRSTDFGQVGFEPKQVPTARKPAFDLGFLVPY